MSRLLSLVVLVGAAVGGWYVYQHYELRGWDQVRLLPRGEKQAAKSASATPSPATPAAATPAAQARSTLRIGVLNLEKCTEQKLAHPRVREVLGQVIGRFDLVAALDVRAANQGLLVRLVELANAASRRRYDFAVPQTVRLDVVEHYSGFLFDQASVEVDRSMVYAVTDPAGQFHLKPLVGVFRARGPEAADAFTFTLIAVALDPDHAEAEAEVLDDVFRKVRDDGRNEDDVILLGSLNLDDPPRERLMQGLNLAAAISAAPTTTRGTRWADNILLNRRATAEFTGRSGVLDLLREFNLSMPEALEVAEHLPVWAELSTYEGGQPGAVDTRGAKP